MVTSSSEAALLGITEQISHGGLTFELQTRHYSSEATDHAISQLLHDGCIVITRRCSNPRSPRVTLPNALPQLIDDQHRRMARDLKQGLLDTHIAAAPGVGETMKTATGEPVGLEFSVPTERARAHFARGLTLLREAADEWRHAVELDAKNSKIVATSSDLLELLDRVTAQIQLPTPLDEIPTGQRRSVAKVHFERGLESARAGDHQSAQQEWSAALTLDPRNQTYRANLSLLHKRTIP